MSLDIISSNNSGHWDTADVQMWLIEPMSDDSLALEPDRVSLRT